MSQWYAVRSATCRENAAAEALEEAGITVFLPLEASWGTRAGKPGKSRVERPLLRGYLFVLIDLVTEEDQVLAVHGVHSFLGYTDEVGDNRPLPVPLPLIIEIQSHERAGRYDKTLYFKPKYDPRKGDRVKITAGPWLNFFGKVLVTPRKQRAHVMVEGPFGRGVMVESKHLTPAAA